MIQTASLEITPEMLVLDAGIDEFKGAWRALGTLAPERLAALRRVATINYGDSLPNTAITGCVQRPSAFSAFSKLSP